MKTALKREFLPLRIDLIFSFLFFFFHISIHFDKILPKQKVKMPHDIIARIKRYYVAIFDQST